MFTNQKFVTLYCFSVKERSILALIPKDIATVIK
jgi:hypothetical protein